MTLQIPANSVITRRSILVGASLSLVCAPAIVQAASLMKVRGLLSPIEKPPYPQWVGFVERLRYDFLHRALKIGWDNKRHGPVVGGMSESAARKAVAHAYAMGWIKDYADNGRPIE